MLNPKLFTESVILSEDQRKVLESWVANVLSQPRKFIMLFRATRNGWSSSNFHSCCDNKGPTVTIVKSGNYIFGGFSDMPWNSKLVQVLSLEFIAFS